MYCILWKNFLENNTNFYHFSAGIVIHILYIFIHALYTLYFCDGLYLLYCWCVLLYSLSLFTSKWHMKQLKIYICMFLIQPSLNGAWIFEVYMKYQCVWQNLLTVFCRILGFFLTLDGKHYWITVLGMPNFLMYMLQSPYLILCYTTNII